MTTRRPMPATRGPRGPWAGVRGQSIVEYLIILPSLLLLVLGAVQFGLLYQIKSQVNYAAFAAARHGALKNASMNSMKDAFGAGMTPIFTPEPTLTGMLRGRAVGAVEAFNPLVTTITRVSPPSSVQDDTTLREQDPDNTNGWIIPNDNLQYRATTVGSSGLNVQDANLLKIRVTYCAKLIVPVANRVFYSLVNGIEGVKALGGRFFSQTGQIATTPNSCSQLKDMYAQKLDTVQQIGSTFGFDISFVTTILTEVTNLLDSTSIPGLNWTVGGLRIPVTAEAVVRMQTPLKFAK